MQLQHLLADPTAIRLEKIIQHESSLTFVVKATRTQAECPRCHRLSSRVHSYYTRKVADLPRHGVAARLELRTRRFRRRNSLCAKRVFCKRSQALFLTTPASLNDALRLIGLILTGEPGRCFCVRVLPEIMRKNEWDITVNFLAPLPCGNPNVLRRAILMNGTIQL